MTDIPSSFPGDVGPWIGYANDEPVEHYSWYHPTDAVVHVYPEDDPMAATVWSVRVMTSPTGDSREVITGVTLDRAFAAAAELMEARPDGWGDHGGTGTVDDFLFTGGL